jgi:hypothetical protein
MSVSHSQRRLSKIWASIIIGITGIFWVYVSILGGVAAYTQIRDLIGSSNNQSHVRGAFRTDGNPGTISFAAKPSDGYSGAHLFIPTAGPQVLSGSFWMETIGWVTLQDVALQLDTTNTGANIWNLSGYAWSEQAGWIDFSGTTYQLSNTSFSWYAWNDGIGWIDMAGASLDMTSSGAIGKVKVIGNLGGNRIFNTIYDLDGKISPATTTKIMNEIRKNVSLVTRNLPANKINTTLATYRIFDSANTVSIGNKLVFENTTPTVARVNYTSNIKPRLTSIFPTDEPIYSVIAIGADIYIDDSVALQNDGKPRVLIALKNDAGVGGNIYISGLVPQIYSSLIAEGSLYSWDFSASTTPILYNDDAGNLFKIPNRQLYIYGTIISNNTIGWYSIDNISQKNYCPYNISPCSNNTALTYDYNHFRDFDPDVANAVQLRGYQPPWLSAPSDIYDTYSLVIERDPRIVSDPPPGLERMQ